MHHSNLLDDDYGYHNSEWNVPQLNAQNAQAKKKTLFFKLLI